MTHQADPLYSQRNPYQIFLLGLSIIVSVPLLRGDAGSGVLEHELDNRTVIAWGIGLLVGSVMAFVGEFWPGRQWTSLVLERFGLMLVAGAAAVYAGVVLLSVSDRTDVAYLSAVQLAYALSCGWRCYQITRRLAWIRLVVEDYDREANA